MMTTDRAKQIIDCYGGNFEQWPVDERLVLQRLLLSHPELLKAHQQALYLDEKLEQYFASVQTLETKQLEKKILKNLPVRKMNADSRAGRNIKIISKLFNIEIVLNTFNNPAKTMGAFALMLLCAISLFLFNENRQVAIQISSGMEDELMLMAESLDYSEELELLAILEPELVEDDPDIL